MDLKISTATTSSAGPRGSAFLSLLGGMLAVPGLAMGVSTLRKGLAGAADARQIALGVCLACLFTGAGIGLIIWGRISARIAARRRELIVGNPGKPWLWRDDWAEGWARTEWKSTAGLTAVIGAVFLLVSAPILMSLAELRTPQRSFKTVAVLVLPVTGVLMLWQGLVAYLRSKKFRETRMRLSTTPCVLGGALKGCIETGFVFPAGAFVDFSLSCVHSYVSGSGKNRTRWENILWQERRTLPVSTDGRKSYIPVEAAIPYDARETDARNPDDQILWRAAANSKLPGLDFRAAFVLPVFKTADSDARITGAAIEVQDEKLLHGEKPQDSKIVTGVSSNGEVFFHLGPARNKLSATVTSLFGACFLAISLFFGFAAVHTVEWILGFIPILACGAMGSLLLAFGCWLWLGTATLTVTNGELHIRSAFLGISRVRVIAASSISDMQLKISLQTGEQAWYDLKLKLTGGRSITAGGELEKREAEWLRAELAKELGISQTLAER